MRWDHFYLDPLHWLEVSNRSYRNITARLRCGVDSKSDVPVVQQWMKETRYKPINRQNDGNSGDGRHLPRDLRGKMDDFLLGWNLVITTKHTSSRGDWGWHKVSAGPARHVDWLRRFFFPGGCHVYPSWTRPIAAHTCKKYTNVISNF